MSAPDISVVVVLHDDADRAALPGLLDSLTAQDVQLETVVVHARGLDGGRAEGLAGTAGRAVAFLRTGDRLLPGALRAGLRALDTYPDSAFVHGRVRPAPGRPPGNDEWPAARDVHVDHYVELLRGNVVGPSCAALFRRSALEDAGLSARDAFGDYALYLRLSRTAPVHFHGELVAEFAPSTRSGELTELAALRTQRRYLGRGTRYRAAYDEGMARLVTSAGVRLGNEIRSARRDRRAALRAATRLAALLATHPRGIPALLGAELLPWVARRRPGSHALQVLAARQERPTGGTAARRIGEAVRHSVPAEAPVVVLGRPDPALDLGDRKARFVAPADWPALTGDDVPVGSFLLVPQSSAWELEQHQGAAEALHDGWTTVWSDETCTIARYGDPDDTLRVLVAGYFSFPDAHATAGDLLVRDQVCRWLEEAGRPYDVAHAPPFAGGVDWRQVDPDRYSHVVFACGPFSPDLASWELLQRFPAARSIGVNLSMLAPLDEWNPFDVLIERDSSRTARADVAFGTAEPKVPVVGVCLREHAPGTRTANAAIRRLIDASAVAAVPIDTRLDVLHGGRNSTGQRTAAEVESLLARMDVVVTTRLHGLVLALKNGVPVVAIDPGNEGFKIRRQAESVGWPVVFGVDEVNDEGLAQALAFCATPEAKALAAQCAARARTEGAAVRDLLLAELGQPSIPAGR